MRTILLLFLIPLSTASFAEECIPKNAQTCDELGCTQSDSAIKIYTNDSNKSVNRCDSRGCSEVVVEIRESGVMKKYGNVLSGYLLLVNSLDNSFTEIATSLNTVFIKSGVCVR